MQVSYRCQVTGACMYHTHVTSMLFYMHAVLYCTLQRLTCMSVHSSSHTLLGCSRYIVIWRTFIGQICQQTRIMLPEGPTVQQLSHADLKACTGSEAR